MSVRAIVRCDDTKRDGQRNSDDRKANHSQMRTIDIDTIRPTIHRLSAEWVASSTSSTRSRFDSRAQFNDPDSVQTLILGRVQTNEENHHDSGELPIDPLKPRHDFGKHRLSLLGCSVPQA